MKLLISMFTNNRLLSGSKMTLEKVNKFNLRHQFQNSLSRIKSDYEEAVEKLNLLQSNSVALLVREKLTALGLDEIHRKDTKTYLKRIGITMEEVDSGLSVIHVTGTKGKGSTCAYCESILRQYGYKTGFFSSPHLISVRERIRINGEPISESDFAYYFWDVYNKLDDNKQEYENVIPFYFMFLTVMAIKVFLVKKVDVAIIEVGIGGEKDCTNIFSNTPVVGITCLGLDHTKLLGDTVDKIAWQKAGIMKKGSTAITCKNQPPSALNVLRERAKEKEADLIEAPSLDEYKWNTELGELNLSGTIRSTNASLGLQLAYAWLVKCGNRGSVENIGKGFCLDDNSFKGIKKCFWPGRQQILTRFNEKYKYFIDGAHTVESMNECTLWFKQQTRGNKTTNVLVFNVTRSRDVRSLYNLLLACNFDIAIFCTNSANNRLTLSSDQLNLLVSEDTQIQICKENEKIWTELYKNNQNVHLRSNLTKTYITVEDAVAFIENLPYSCNILVTGSLHLVGAFFNVIGPELINNK